MKTIFVYGSIFLLVLSFSLAYAPEALNIPHKTRFDSQSNIIVPGGANIEYATKLHTRYDNVPVQFVPPECVKFDGNEAKVDKCIADYEQKGKKTKFIFKQKSIDQCKTLLCAIRRLK